MNYAPAAPPRLIGALAKLQASLRAGEQSTSAEQEVRGLLRDRGEVLRATLWLDAQNRLPELTDLRQARQNAILEALTRDDLTMVEGFQLYDAVNEEIDRLEQAAAAQTRAGGRFSR